VATLCDGESGLLKPSEHMLLALRNVHELSPTPLRVFRKSSARLPVVFLTAMGADDAQIEASFSEAISTAHATEVDFAGETRRRNPCGISEAKTACVTRTWIPTTSWIILAAPCLSQYRDSGSFQALAN